MTASLVSPRYSSVSAARTEKAVIDGTTSCDGDHKSKYLRKYGLQIAAARSGFPITNLESRDSICRWSTGRKIVASKLGPAGRTLSSGAKNPDRPVSGGPRRVHLHNRPSELGEKELFRDLHPVLTGNMGGHVIHSHAAILRQRSEGHRHLSLQTARRFLSPPTGQRTTQ
jgi:hypothetical protein